MSNKETVLHVDGMSCSNCVRHVEGALRKIDGVGAVEVNLGEGKVTVEHDPDKAPVAKMIEAIVDAGYEPRASGA